jgi:hypothetical protein
MSEPSTIEKGTNKLVYANISVKVLITLPKFCAI